MSVVHLLLLGVSVAALVAAGTRCAAAASDLLPARLLGAAAVAGSIALVTALLLGLVRLGGSPVALAVAAAGVWVGCRLVVAAPAVGVASQVRQWWAQAPLPARVGLLVLVALTLTQAAYQCAQPLLGQDGLTYHAAQAVIWVRDGRPGSLHQTLQNFPTQAYPRTFEVLVGWTYALGRTPLAAVPLVAAFPVLLVGSVVTGLRRQQVGLLVTALATAAVVLVPLNVLELSGVENDLPALAWLAVTVALCVLTVDEPGCLALAVVAAGLAVGTKPTTAPFAVVGLVWAGWRHRRQLTGRLTGHAATLLPAAALALATGGVWYVVNAVVYHAPLWPFSRFPSGPPQPPVWQDFGGRFLRHPVASVTNTGSHLIVSYFGGALWLLAAVPVLLLLTLLPSTRPVRRLVLLGCALVVGEALLWSDAQFTASTPQTAFLLTGLRYLVPAPAAAAVLLALVSRVGGLLRAVCVSLLVLAVGTDVLALREQRFGVPVRPPVVALLAACLVGAVTAAVLSAEPRLVQGVFRPGAAALAGLTAVAALAAPAATYTRRYLDTSRLMAYDDAPVVRFLAHQPGWAHGDAPVAAGGTTYASFAGPHFQHTLTRIPDDEPCASIRALARRQWVILRLTTTTGAFRGLGYSHAPLCLAGVAPAATLGKGFRVYAPAALLRPVR